MTQSLRFDLFHSAGFRLSNPPTREAGNAADQGVGVDMTGFERCFFLIAVGTFADAAAELTPLVEHRNGADAYTAVADADMIPDAAAELQITQANDDRMLVIGYQGGRDDVRLTLTTTNNAGNVDFSAVAVLTGARHTPQRTTQAVIA